MGCHPQPGHLLFPLVQVTSCDLNDLKIVLDLNDPNLVLESSPLEEQ